MKLAWTITDETAQLTLTPETVTDKAVIEGLGNVQTASVKKNGVLAFVMELPRQAVAKPIIERPADAVRDSKETI